MSTTSSAIAPRLYGGPLISKRVTKQLQYMLDISVLATAFLLAYAIRFDFDVPGDLDEVTLLVQRGDQRDQQVITRVPVTVFAPRQEGIDLHLRQSDQVSRLLRK